MDYLDPKKQFRHRITLAAGYILMTIGILIATVILLYEAYGFGLGKNGTIIQNGLVFFASQPNPAKIYINKKLEKNQTNTSIELPSGTYSVRLSRSGYRNWSRSITVDGGTVAHFDYPLLVPTNIRTATNHSYSAAPGLVTESPNRRWLLIQSPTSNLSFDVYDLNNPTAAPTTLTLPSSIVSTAQTSQSWKLEEWSNDNQHVVLTHIYDGKTEYIELNRTDPASSINVTQTLAGDSFTSLTLDNKAYNQFYLYDKANQSLYTASLADPTATMVISNVVTYDTYGTNTVLYISDQDGATAPVELKEMIGTQSYDLKSFPNGTTYLLDEASFNGLPYVVAGASSENKLYVFADPVSQLNSDLDHAIVPIAVLHVPNPSYESFSANAQFIMVESGQNFAVFDLLNTAAYTYTTTEPLDAPQDHATWMDGDRITYISNGTLNIFDYDNTNHQTLVAALPQYLPIFDTNYTYAYSLVPKHAGSASTNLQQMSFYTKADQP